MTPLGLTRNRTGGTRLPPAPGRGRLCAILCALLAASGSAGAGAPGGGPASRPASAPAALVLEGFERPNRVRTWPEKLEAVTEGEGVTEGRQAARLPGGQSVLVKAKGEDCTRHGWLKFDTLTLQPLSHPLRISASAPNFYREAYAYAQAGRDTVALPLSGFFRPGGTPDELDLTLLNVSDRSVIVDNLRLEPAASPPPGCLALDFGPDWAMVWPGFSLAGINCPQIAWSGRVPVGHWDYRVPDPLGGSFVGPALGSKVSDTFDLVAPERNCTAWLWVTHFADQYAQPLEHVLSLHGKVLARRQIARGQLLSAEGLMEGMGGEWTPRWFDAVHAPRLVEVVRLALPDVRSPVAVGNCQLAALALAPAPAKAAMTAYVDQVQADQARYRRQFIVGMRNDPRCDLNPAEAETSAGLILLSPSHEDAFRPDWKPKESDRAAKVSLVATGGLLAVAPVVVAPLKKTPALVASVGPLRAADGHGLVCVKDSPEVLFCKTLPRVHQARADQQPWLLTRKHPPAEERQLVWMVLKVQPAPDAKPGLYQGAIRLNLGAATAQVPVEVQVVATGQHGKDAPTLTPLHSGHPADFYTSLVTDDLTDATRDGLQEKVCQQLLEAGSSLCLPGVVLNGDLSVSDGRLARQLRTYPARSVRGWTLLDCQQAVETFRGVNTPPGSQQYQQAVGQLVKRTSGLATAAGLRDYHILLGTFWDQNWMPDRVRLGAAIEAAGGSAALFFEDNWLARTPKDQVSAAFSSAGAAIFLNYQKDLASWVAAYRKAHPGGRAYVYCDRPDRLGPGLFAAAVGADGACVNGVARRAGTYCGFSFDGGGLLALESDGTLVPTLASLWLQQAEADFRLVRRAEELLRAAAAAKTDAAELSKTLQDLKAAMIDRRVGLHDYQALRSAGFTRTEIESWRKRLLDACGKAWVAMAPP